MSLCRSRDSFVEEKVIWVVDLSSGETIFQDDARDGCDPSSAWLRLSSYVEENNLQINRMRLRYWDHLVFLPDNADGYYFSKGASYDSVSGVAGDFYNAGILDDEKILINKYTIPELLRVGQEKTMSVDKGGIFLIRNHNAR